MKIYYLYPVSNIKKIIGQFGHINNKTTRVLYKQLFY